MPMHVHFPCGCTFLPACARFVQAICGYTWPGIEYGEPPSCPYTFFEVRSPDNIFFN